MDGNIIETFYQWDINQKVIIDVNDFDNYIDSNTIAPKIHFSTKKMSKSLLVQSKITNGSIVVDVPNILLEDCYSIEIYFYFTSKKNNLSQRTIASTTIPIRQKNKPDNYEYQENITNYTFEDLVQAMLDTYNKLDFATVEEMKTYLKI